MIEITSERINVDTILAHVGDAGAGAIDVFIGTSRDNTNGRRVVCLEFEAYIPMAKKELQKIASKAKEQWDVLKFAIVHRVGVVEIGEAAVIIAVATPHRAHAFEACRFIIDELKKTVPIWKKERFEDGEVWVSAHP